MKLGEYIKQKRNEKGLTQTQLANLINKNIRTIQNWEDSSIAPNGLAILKLIEILDLDHKKVKEFLENEKED